MSVKEGLMKICGFLKDKAIEVGKAFMNASLSNVVRFGIAAGVAVVTSVIIFRAIKNKVQVWRSGNRKDPVDHIMDINYNDARKRKNLHKRMKKVSKELNYGTKKKYRKNRYSSLYKLIWDDARENDIRSPKRWDDLYHYAYRCYDKGYTPMDTMDELREFYDYFFNYNVDGDPGEDNQVLYRVWHDTNYSYGY